MDQVESLPPRFQTRGLIGFGGMGVVYRVYDAELQREVALKTVGDRGPAQVARLKREFRVRAGISHPNLLRLYEMADREGAWFTMELTEGVDLMTWLRGSPAATPPQAPPTLTLSVASGAAPPPTIVAPTQTAPQTAAPVDPARLRGALGQLLRGLHALHQAGLVHRDVKPANVMVRPDGRLLLLDFGLAAELESAAIVPSAVEIAGTPGYMAPEQRAGLQPTPAVDLYAVGVILYRCLADLPPPVAPRTPSADWPPDPRDRAPDAPPDLADLARDLLAWSPADRPSVAACLRRLGPLAGPEPLEAAVPRDCFVGREAELAGLRAAHERLVATGAMQVVHVEGPPGIGKSSLVRHFLRELSAERQVEILEGRCHPGESVLFSAFDAVIENLARLLARLPKDELAAVLPERRYALRAVFPALGAVAEVAADVAQGPSPEPRELRQRGFEALRQLLVGLAALRPLILWIDDLQWGDLDSAPLFSTLMAAGRAPGALWILTTRTEDRATSPLLRALDELPERGAWVQLAVGPMSPLDAGALASTLLGEDRGAALVARAAGSPYFLTELARQAAARGEESGGLEELIARRLDELSPSERLLLETTAVIGRPVEHGLAISAAGLEPAARIALGHLEDLRLLRAASRADRWSVGFYHNIVRDVVLGALGADALVARHRSVAEVLETRHPDDLESLATHWEGAGELGRAGGYAARAGDAAATSLAFERAVDHYGKALAWLGDPSQRSSLLERRATALSNLGRGPEAAQTFVAAAEDPDRRARGGLEIVALRRRAAEEYIGSLRVAEGWALMRTVLAELGLRYPGGPLRAMLSALLSRLSYLMRGLSFTPDPGRAPDPRTAEQMRALWSATTRFTLVNHLLADPFRLMYLRLALRQGEMAPVVRALAYECAMLSFLSGGWFQRKRDALIAQVTPWVESTGDPYDQAWFALMHGTRAFCDGAMAECALRCAESARIFSERCVGVRWEHAIAKGYQYIAQIHLGRLAALSADMDAYLEQARAVGDHFADTVCLLGGQALVWTARDRLAEGERHRALLSPVPRGPASWPAEAYNSSHQRQLVNVVQTELYRGRPHAALAEVESQWRALESGMFLTLRYVGPELHQLRGRAALAAAAPAARHPQATEDAPAAHDRGALLKIATSASRTLRRDGGPLAAPWGLLLDAGVQRSSGAAEGDVVALLEQALDGFERADLGLYVQATRWALGRRAEAEAALSEQGVVHPALLVQALAPGLVGPPGLRSG